MRRGRPKSEKALRARIRFACAESQLDEVKTLAERESRSLSMMARTLVTEALAARKAGEPPAGRRGRISTFLAWICGGFVKNGRAERAH